MDTLTRKKYIHLQWRTLAILIIGYALYYFVRKNFSFAMPTLEKELGLTKAQLGLFLTCNQIVYGVSKLISGMIADRASARKLMSLGLFIAALSNIAIGFTPQMNGIFNVLDASGKITLGGIYFIGAMWVINGFVQSLGYPPCATIMARWFRPSELATKQSIWNSSHSIGAGLVALIVAGILKYFGDEAWQWCFFVPSILAIFGSVLIFFGLKDKPSDAGLPDPEALDEDDKESVSAEEGVQVTETGKNEIVLSPVANRKLINKLSFGNPIIWLVAFSDFFIYVIRLAIVDWGTTFLHELKGMDVSLAATLVATAEIAGGILGMLVAGWATDKFFHSKAHQTSLICTVCATICLLLFWKVPVTWVSIIFLIMTTFFIYGPQALLGISASNHATKKAAGTANGFVGLVSYLSPIVSGWLFGVITDRTGNWDGVFMVALGFGIAGVICMAFMWKAPADGYAKAEKLAQEYAKQYPVEQK